MVTTFGDGFAELPTPKSVESWAWHPSSPASAVLSRSRRTGGVFESLALEGRRVVAGDANPRDGWNALFEKPWKGGVNRRTAHEHTSPFQGSINSMAPFPWVHTHGFNTWPLRGRNAGTSYGFNNSRLRGRATSWFVLFSLIRAAGLPDPSLTGRTDQPRCYRPR